MSEQEVAKSTDDQLRVALEAETQAALEAENKRMAFLDQLLNGQISEMARDQHQLFEKVKEGIEGRNLSYFLDRYTEQVFMVELSLKWWQRAAAYARQVAAVDDRLAVLRNFAEEETESLLRGANWDCHSSSRISQARAIVEDKARARAIQRLQDIVKSVERAEKLR
jgi:hypothetical protein